MEFSVNPPTDKVNTMNQPISQKAANVIFPGKMSVYDTTTKVAESVGKHILSQVEALPKSVLGLATGETPKPVYQIMVEAHRARGVSFGRTTTFNLDEYVGLPQHHPDAFAAYMRRELFDHADFSPDRIHLLSGYVADLEQEAAAYEAAIVAAGGIDVQLLGIGSNGHIGFNEPGSRLDSRTRRVQLSSSTGAANLASMIARDTVPSSAITMGIATILKARQIIVMATGARKADAIRHALLEAPDSECPASFLTFHPDVRWFLDRDAASLLT